MTTIGGNGFFDILQPPTLLVKKINGIFSYGRDFPHPDDDGKYIRLPADTTGNLELLNADNTQEWAVAVTDINADCDHWTGVFWLDTANSKIWVWAYDTGTEPDLYYLATVALADGTVVNVGTCEPGDGLFSNTYQYYYSSMGTGVLTIRDGDYKIILDTSDGSIDTAAAQVTQNGGAISPYMSYETEDGAIYVGVFSFVTASNICITTIMRGGVYRNVHIPLGSPLGINNAYAKLWGDYVAMANIATYACYNARFFSRSDFDDWLVRIADFYGLPT